MNEICCKDNTTTVHVNWKNTKGEVIYSTLGMDVVFYNGRGGVMIKPAVPSFVLQEPFRMTGKFSKEITDDFDELVRAYNEDLALSISLIEVTVDSPEPCFSFIAEWYHDDFVKWTVQGNNDIGPEKTNILFVTPFRSGLGWFEYPTHIRVTLFIDRKIENKEYAPAYVRICD